MRTTPSARFIPLRAAFSTASQSSAARPESETSFIREIFSEELHGRCVYLGLEPVAFVQHRHPAGQGEIQLPHRKLVEHLLQNFAQLRLVEVEAAHRQNGPAIALFHFRRHRSCLGGVGVGAVEQDDEGLAQRFQLVDDPLFCRDVVFAGYLADGAVGGDDDADGGVVPVSLPVPVSAAEVEGGSPRRTRGF